VTPLQFHRGLQETSFYATVRRFSRDDKFSIVSREQQLLHRSTNGWTDTAYTPRYECALHVSRGVNRIIDNFSQSIFSVHSTAWHWTFMESLTLHARVCIAVIEPSSVVELSSTRHRRSRTGNNSAQSHHLQIIPATRSKHLTPCQSLAPVSTAPRYLDSESTLSLWMQDLSK